MLDRAKFLVVSEISEVVSEPSEAIEQKVEKALERCLANRARQLAKERAAKVKAPEELGDVSEAAEVSPASP